MKVKVEAEKVYRQPKKSFHLNRFGTVPVVPVVPVVPANNCESAIDNYKDTLYRICHGFKEGMQERKSFMQNVISIHPTQLKNTVIHQ